MKTFSSPSNASHGPEVPPHSAFRRRPNAKRWIIAVVASDAPCAGEIGGEGSVRSPQVSDPLVGASQEILSLGKTKELKTLSHRLAGASDGLCSTANANPGSVQIHWGVIWRPFPVGSMANAYHLRIRATRRELAVQPLNRHIHRYD